MSSRLPCSQCGRTSFHEEDGILFCDGGHQQEGGQNTAEDDGDYAAAGKLSRKKINKEKQKVFRVYRGAKGYKLFLQAWQFILWKQCHALVHDMGLPAELWTLVRELWTLRLTQLVHRYEEEDHTGTSTEPESVSNTGEDKIHTARKSTEVTSDSLRLSDTIALCYLAILLLRQPVRLATLYRSIRREEICYIRAIRHIPQDIRNHLAPSYHAALDTTIVPGQDVLQKAVVRTVNMYITSFEMFIPPINWTLLLIDAIRTLSLPLEIFPVAQHLIKLVGFNFAYPVSTQKRLTATALPETQLMAIISVATKLLFPFEADGLEAHPYSVSEPTAMQMDWTAWLEEKSKNVVDTPSSAPIELGKEIEVTDKDVLEMDDAQLDQYMDWFQRTYAKDKEENNLHKQMLDMFPLSEPRERKVDFRREEEQRQEHNISRLKATQSMLKTRKAIPGDEKVTVGVSVLRPGQQYKQYRVPEDLTGASRAFHNEAAEMACLSVDALLRAITRTERILLLRQQNIRRSEVFDDDDSEMEQE